jgi:hypothetical protein
MREQEAQPANPHQDYLRRYWQDGFDGKPLGACTGDAPLQAWHAGKRAAQPAAQGPSDWHKSVRSVVLNYDPAEPAPQKPHTELTEHDQLLWKAMCTLRGMDGYNKEEVAKELEAYFGVATP